MNDVHLLTAMFASVNRLTEILNYRQLSFNCSKNIEYNTNNSARKCRTLILSVSYMNEVGKEAIISFAKSLTANQICIVNELDDKFDLSFELGGKILFFNLYSENLVLVPIKL